MCALIWVPPSTAQRGLETVAGGGLLTHGPWAGRARRKAPRLASPFAARLPILPPHIRPPNTSGAGARQSTRPTQPGLRRRRICRSTRSLQGPSRACSAFVLAASESSAGPAASAAFAAASESAAGPVPTRRTRPGLRRRRICRSTRSLPLPSRAGPAFVLAASEAGAGAAGAGAGAAGRRESLVLSESREAEYYTAYSV